MDEVMKHAEVLWNFAASPDNAENPDLIVCLGSYDLRVADKAASLAGQFGGAKIIVTGGFGNWTRGVFIEPEAEIFGRRIEGLGVDSQRIYLDVNASNIGENIENARTISSEWTVNEAVFVTKPQTILRVRHTIPVKWPTISRFHVDAPRLSFGEYVSNDIVVDNLINEMVGDVERMLLYPSKGYQISCDVPEVVIESFKILVSHGFTKHLLS